MCKHVLNAQVAIRAPCCRKWFDCPQCHAETQDHKLKKTTEMVMVCKKCKRAFRKDLATYDESDEFCPFCDNHYVVDAKTPKPMYNIEGEDARVDNRMFMDERADFDPRWDFYRSEVEAQASERIDHGGIIGALQGTGQGDDNHRGMLDPDMAAAQVKQRATELDINDDDLDWS